MVGGKVQWEGRAVPSDDESDLSGVGSGSDEEYLADAMSDRLNLTVKLGSFKDLAGPPAMFQINSGDVDEFLSRANKTVAEVCWLECALVPDAHALHCRLANAQTMRNRDSAARPLFRARRARLPRRKATVPLMMNGLSSRVSARGRSHPTTPPSITA